MGTNVIIIISVVVVALILLIMLSLLRYSGSSGFRSGVRKGYRDVVVRDAVDVKSQVYISEVSDYVQVDEANNVTRITDGNTPRWTVTFHDVVSGDRSRFRFSNKMVIGRVPSKADKEVRFLVNNDIKVSKSHCAISVSKSGDNLMVYDLGSRNGTWLNGKKLTRPVKLRSGDRLCVGDKTYVLQILKG